MPAARRRTRREHVPAKRLRKGDVIAPDGHGSFKATVIRSGPHHHDRTWRLVDFVYPDDFTVNARFRGERSSRSWPNDHLVTRYTPY
jgi:hypothetical protein